MEPLYTTFALFAVALVHALVLVAWRERIRGAVRGPQCTTTGADVQVTIVVPARNAETTLIPLLQDLFAQNMPKDQIDVIVVDDHSEDGTAAIVKSMMRTWPQLGYCLNRGQGKKAAITTGVELAKAGILLLTDADVRCGPERARAVVHAFGIHAWDMMLLPVRTEGGSSLVGRLQEEEQAGLLGVAAGEALLGRPSLSNGANMAVTREAFLAVGGYQGDGYSSGDDLFLVKRMLKAGRSVGYLLMEEAVVTTAAAYGWKAFLHQRLRWAGKMHAVSATVMMVGLLSMSLPWLLLVQSMHFQLSHLLEEHGIEMVALLCVSWLLWLVPSVALVMEAKRFLGQRRSFLIAALCYMVFMVYSPMIALLAKVMPTQWKGRPVRT